MRKRKEGKERLNVGKKNRNRGLDLIYEFFWRK
jgi:hypothetical protein